MIPLIIVAIIATILICVLFISVKFEIYVYYNTDKFVNELKLKYGFIEIYPLQNKKKRTDVKSDEKEPDNISSDKIIQTVLMMRNHSSQIKELIYSILGYLFKHSITIKKLRINMKLGLEDAMETALFYGAVCAFVYNTVGVTEHYMKLKDHNILITPIFNRNNIFVEFENILSTNIFHATVILFILAKRVIPILNKIKRRNENGKSNKRPY